MATANTEWILDDSFDTLKFPVKPDGYFSDVQLPASKLKADPEHFLELSGSRNSRSTLQKAYVLVI